MSILNSKFDIVSVDNPLAVAALAQVLKVGNVGAASGLYSGGDVANNFAGGTPLQGAVAYPPGTVVQMNTSGEAVLATATTAGSEAVAPVAPTLMFVTIDGNTDYSGKFVRKLTVLHGGFTMITDQFDAEGGFEIGAPVSVKDGKIVSMASGADGEGKRVFGFVGPNGYDAAAGTLEVICPQGAGI